VNPKVPPRMVEEFRLNLSADTELALTYENFSNKLEQHFRLLWRQKNTASIDPKPTPGFQNVIHFDQSNLPQGYVSGNSYLTAYTQFEHMKFCLDMHNIATDINSIPTRTTNISDSNYDTILHTHFTLVIKAYLMYTDENQDELLGQRQYLLYYRKLKSETWDLTYGCSNIADYLLLYYKNHFATAPAVPVI